VEEAIVSAASVITKAVTRARRQRLRSSTPPKPAEFLQKEEGEPSHSDSASGGLEETESQARGWEEDEEESAGAEKEASELLREGAEAENNDAERQAHNG